MADLDPTPLRSGGRLAYAVRRAQRRQRRAARAVPQVRGAYQVNVGLRLDSGSWNNSAWQTISDASHYIEIDWQAATSAGANDGYASLWVDGVLKTTLSGKDNDTRRVDEARLGPLAGIDSGTSGTEYFDAFESRRSTYIGPAGGGTAMQPVTKTYYSAGGLVAMREITSGGNALYFLHTDHPRLRGGRPGQCVFNNQ
jgi:hypothetical protein